MFRNPCAIMIVGPSGSGKTVLTAQILQHRDKLFERKIKKVVYCYGEEQPLFKTIARYGVSFHKGLPPEDLNKLFPQKSRPGLIVLDDLMAQAGNDERISGIFTKESHHKDISVIYLAQNMFPPGKFSRTISLQAHYIIAFQSPRDKLGVRNLVQQSFPGEVQEVMNVYQVETERPHGYLMFDFHPKSPQDARLVTDIIPGQSGKGVSYYKREFEDDSDEEKPSKKRKRR